jgi:Glycogen recognition site of AMP-activated protein kinase
MNDRIDQYVEERADGEALARAVSDTRAFIEARPAPDLTAAVMQRVSRISDAEPVRRPGAFATVIRFLWLPRQFSIRPAYAVAAAGAVLALFVALESQTTTVRTTEAGPRLFVQFRLETDAMNVQLAGTFTNWEPAYQLHQRSPGVWTIAVPLPQGVHDYAFIVDGQRWVADPYAPRVNDGFGGTNSRLTLLLPDTQRL